MYREWVIALKYICLTVLHIMKYVQKNSLLYTGFTLKSLNIQNWNRSSEIDLETICIFLKIYKMVYEIKI